MPYLSILMLEFKNDIVIFKISTIEFLKLQNFVKKRKSLIFGPKMPYLGILMLEFKSDIVIFEISTLEFV